MDLQKTNFVQKMSPVIYLRQVFNKALKADFMNYPKNCILSVRVEFSNACWFTTRDMIHIPIIGNNTFRKQQLFTYKHK